MDVGVDVGMRRLAIACPEAGWAMAYLLPVSTRRDRELHLLQEWFWHVLPERSSVWCEAQFEAARDRSVGIKLAMTSAMVLASAIDRDGTAQLVAPATWKKQVVGRGDADKDAVAAWLLAAHPALSEACADDQDRVDAMCLGLYGADVRAGLVGPGPLPRRRRSSGVLRAQRPAADEPA